MQGEACALLAAFAGVTIPKLLLLFAAGYIPNSRFDLRVLHYECALL